MAGRGRESAEFYRRQAAKENTRRLEEIKLNKFFVADEIFSHKYPMSVGENFSEEINFNTHDSSEYAIARSATDENGNQRNIDTMAIEPYVVFEFMKLMTQDKQGLLKDWQAKNNLNVHNVGAMKERLEGATTAAGLGTEAVVVDGEITEEATYILHDEARQLINAAAAEKGFGSYFDKATRVFGGSIAMYMPTDVQINDTIGYNEESRQVAAALGGVINGEGDDMVNNATIFNPGTFAAGAGGLSLLASAASKSNNARIAGSQITKLLGKGNVGITSLLGYGVGGVLSDEMQRHHGAALNPNEYMAYANTPMRSFSFAFNFLPDSAEESAEATQIIKQFRIAAHATKTDNLTITVPDHCIVSFHGAADMIQLPPVVIDSVSVSYNPNNTSFFKHNNAPVEIGLSVTLKEIAPIYKDDVRRGF